MRSTLTLFGAVGLTVLAGCTVKSVEPPALSGPSTLATSIVMTAARDSIIQNGVDSTTIAIQALGPDGQSRTVTLRAEIFVDGIAQDFGTLSNKAPVTPTSITYFAPPAPLESVGSGTRVTIVVTPVGGDYRGEIGRQIDINVIPPGVILPPNGAPVPAFVITPLPANTRQTLNFDASATLDEGVLCLTRCTYAWTFGDNTSGTGMVATHEYRATGTYSVTLTVTDQRGTSASLSQTLAVGATAPPTATFTFSPSVFAANQDIFFNASGSTAVTGRRIVNYGWDFGDGQTASGVTVTHRYSGNGTFKVTLTVVDDSDAQDTDTKDLTVGTSSTTGSPTAALTFLPSSPKVGQAVAFDASGSLPGTSATITSYKFNYGDGTEETVAVPQQSHTYGATGTVIATVTVTDSLGRTAQKSVTVTIASP